MLYREHLPQAPLNRFVRCIWVLEDPTARGEGPVERVVPDGCAELVFHLADPFARRAAREAVETTQHRTAFVGQLRRYIDIRPLGRVALLGVRFEPAGAAALLGLPMLELTGESLALADVWGRGAGEFEGRLRAAADHDARIALVERTLLDRWLRGRRGGRGRRRARHPTRAEGGPVVAAVAEIQRTAGRAPMDRVVAATGVGARQLERRFLREVGLSPKRLARIVRFQRALDMLRTTHARWAAIALDCGYFDQAHLNREFRDFAGQSPSRYLGTEQPIAERFLG